MIAWFDFSHMRFVCPECKARKPIGDMLPSDVRPLKFQCKQCEESQ